MTDHSIFQKLAELRNQRVAFCLATIVDTNGSTPRERGAKMIVCVDGSTWGSVGGGCGEASIRSTAFRCLLETKRPELIEVDLTEDIGTTGTDVCGGKMWIYVEPEPF